MCGICGVIGEQVPGRAEAIVRAMTARMVHRGPDDEGVFVDGRVALGMRRLSIIDIAGGHQPVFNEDGTLAVVFNGEIYNFQELRRRLESLGHTFRSASDTEVIIHGFEEWGADCVDHLEGMFAFALAETSKGDLGAARRVVIARDRLGIKPLYYTARGGKLLFASEVRALLGTGEVPRKLSSPALQSYLLFGSVGEPMTLVDGVFSIPPGHRLVVEADCLADGVQPQPYWDFARAVRPSTGTWVPERTTATTNLRKLLEETVERHLIADVPVGVFLSSGIDSTALVALAASKKTAVHTVSVVFPEQEFSEARLARQTAKRFGTTHRELMLSGEDVLQRLGECVGGLDQPSMDGVNTYFVSWSARQAGLKVALSGLGGDEVFGGYKTFRSTSRVESAAAVARHFPAGLRSATAGAFEKVASLRAGNDPGRKVSAVWRDPDALPHSYFYTRLLFTPPRVAELLNRGGESSSSDPWRQWLVETAKGAAQLDDFSAVSCLEARSYMVSTLLRDTDAMSMAHSLEVRVPYLDHPLIEFVGGLPDSFKRVNGVPKALLVEALSDLLPPEVVYQKKRTFTLPWERWLRGTLKPQVSENMTSLAPALRPVLNADAVERVWTDYLNGHTSWSRVWSLFVLNEWSSKHLSGS